jgi:hypothetical protein
VAIFEKQLSAITPELMPGSSPNINHRYIYLVRIFYRMPARVSTQEVSTMALHGHYIYSVLV